MNTLKKSFLILTLFAVSCFENAPLFAQEQAGASIENLAFKILQKQAAEYEQALSEMITKKLGAYIPENRFHLSVRVFWNPYKIKELQERGERGELKRKQTKLPGFPIFVKEAERGLDYYMGAGSVMKLRVEVLLDETLSEGYTDFIYQLVPIQARFVPERGDSVKVTRIPFPEGNKKQTVANRDIPLSSDEASAALLRSIEEGKKEFDDSRPVILNPVLQKYVLGYETHVTEKLRALISKYVDKKKYLLNVKFFWNPDEINKLKKMVMRTDVEGKVKLPGFTIYLEERDTLYKMMGSSTTLLRLEISLMLDESVSPDVEPFMRKLIPMSVSVLPKRGDQLIIFRGYFPRLGGDLRATLSGKTDKALKSDMEFKNEINHAFFQGDYRRGLILVDLLLSKKTAPFERLPLLKKKGSLHLLLQEKELARAAWEQVRKINPESTDTIEFLGQLK